METKESRAAAALEFTGPVDARAVAAELAGLFEALSRILTGEPTAETRAELAELTGRAGRAMRAWSIMGAVDRSLERDVRWIATMPAIDLRAKLAELDHASHRAPRVDASPREVVQLLLEYALRGAL